MDPSLGWVEGEVEAVHRYRGATSFEWRIRHFSALRQGLYSSPVFNCLSMRWRLQIAKSLDSPDNVILRKEGSIRRRVRFTIGSRTAEGGVADVIRDELLLEDFPMAGYRVPAHTYPPDGAVFTCTLQDGNSPLRPLLPDAVRTMARSTCGEVKGRTASFEWTIPDCSALRPGLYSSPTVHYFDAGWFLEIDKNTRHVETVHLRRAAGVPGPVRFTIGCRTPDGREGRSLHDRPFVDNSAACAFHIPADLFSPGEFTFSCTLRKDDGPSIYLGPRREGATCSSSTRGELVNLGFRGVSRETQTEDAHCRSYEHLLKDISILRGHFKNVLLSGDDHDVLLKVKDKQFRAHKCVLRARSPVFAAMFGSNMAESAEGSVTIEDCDPDTFGDFLQFVYSGAVDIASVGRALGLYYLGDKYDFPSLKEMCVEFLKNSFTTTTIFDVVNLAARHDEEELLRQAIVFFADNLEEVMFTVEWQRFLAACPVQANEMSLKAVQCLKTSLRKK